MKIILEYRKPKQIWTSFTTGCVMVDTTEINNQLFWDDDYGVFRTTIDDIPSDISYATYDTLYTFKDINPPFIETRHYSAPVPIMEKSLRHPYITIAKLSLAEYEHVMEYLSNCEQQKALLLVGKYFKSIGNEVRYFCLDVN